MADSSNGLILFVNAQLSTAGLEAQLKQETLKLSKEATIKADFKLTNDAGKSIQITKQRISTFVDEAGNEVVKLTENIARNGATISSQVEAMGISFKNASTQIKESSDNASKGVDNLGNAMKKNKGNADDFTSSLKSLFETTIKVAKFSLITQGLNAVSDAMTNAIQTAHDYDDALTDLQKVSDLTGSDLGDYAQQLGELGQPVSRTRTEMVQGATGYKQSGYSDEDSARLAQYSALLQNISDEEISAGDATSFIISQLKAFGSQLGNTNDVAEQTTTVLDALNEVSNNYAVSSSDLEQGLKNLASTSSAMGNSYEETLGMLAAVTEITRNASVASRGLRQIFSRLTQTLDDGSSTGKKLVSIYNELGISLKDENGEMRSSYDILKDLSAHWNDLDKNQQEYIAITSAGANQVNNFLALMTNFDDAVKATNTALDSSGSAWEENRKYMESTSAKMNLLKGQFQELVLGDGGLVKLQKTVLDVGIAFLQFANSDVGQTIIQIGAFAVALVALNKAITVLPPIIGLVTGAFTTLSTVMLTTPAGQLTAVLLLLGSALIGVKNYMDYASKSAERMADSLEETQKASEDEKKKLENISDQLKDTKKQIEDIKGKGKLELTDEQQLDQLNRQYINLQNQYQYQKLIADEAEREAKAKLESASTEKYNVTTYKMQKFTGNAVDSTRFQDDDFNGVGDTYYANETTTEKMTAVEGLKALTEQLKENTDQMNSNTSSILTNNKTMEEGRGNVDALTQANSELSEQNKQLIDGYNSMLSENQDIVKIVKELADAGDEEAQKVYDGFIKCANGAEIASNGVITFDDSLENSENAIDNVSEKSSNLSDMLNSINFDSVDKALEEIKKNGKLSADSIEGISKSLESVGVDSTKYVQSLTDVNTTASQQKEILGEVSAQLLLNSKAVQGLTADNVKAVGQFLELRGVENGVAVAEALLAEKQYETVKSSNSESGALNNLQGVSKETAKQILALEEAKIRANVMTIKTDGDIENLIALANAAGAAAVAVAKAKQAIAITENYTKNGLNGSVGALKQQEYAQQTKSQIQNGTYDWQIPDYKPLDLTKYNGSNTNSSGGGGGSKGGGGKSSGKSDAEKAQEEALKAYKENAQKAFKENEHLYNMGKKSAQEYYQDLADLNKQYYGETSQYASKFLDEFQSNEEKVYQGFQKLAKEAIDKQKDALKQQKKALQDEERDEEDSYNDRIDRLKEKESDLTDAIEEQIDALNDKKDEISDYWEKRLDALDETNDKIEKQIQLEKYEQELATARAKKVKVFKDGRFVWTSDQDAINSAQEELNSYKRKLAQEEYKKELENQRDAELKIYEDEIDALKKKEDNIKKQYEEEIKTLQKRLSKIKKYYQEEEDELDDLGDAYDAMSDKIKQFQYDTNLSLEQNLANFMAWAKGIDAYSQQAINSMKKASEAEIEFGNNLENFKNLAESGKYGNKTAEQLQWEYQYSHGMISGNGGSGATSSGGIGPGYHTSSGSGSSSSKGPGYHTSSGSGSSSSKGPGYHTSSGSSSKGNGGYTSGSGHASNGDKIVTNKITVHARGDNQIPEDEMAVVGENPNKEILIGSKLNNGTLMRLSKGTGVVNAHSVNTLAGMLNSIGSLNPNIGSLSERAGNVSQTFHFDNITLPNVKDANSFVRELSDKFNNYAIQYANIRK